MNVYFIFPGRISDWRQRGLYLCDLMLSYLVIIWMYILYFQEEFLITDDLFVEYFNAFLALPVCTCDFFVSFGTKMLLNARHRYCFSGSNRVAMSNFCDLVNFSITIQPRLTILNPNDLDLIFMVTIFGWHIDDRGCILIFMSPWPNFSFVDLILFSEKHLTQMFQVTDMTQISLHLIVLASDINSLYTWLYKFASDIKLLSYSNETW